MALEDFDSLGRIADFPCAAEANYWEALAHWDRVHRLVPPEKAQKAFARSLDAAAKDPRAGGAFASYALQGLVELTRKHAKNNPDGAVDWLLAVEPAWRTLRKDDALARHQDFVAASA